jgi:hypothetical protein
VSVSKKPNSRRPATKARPLAGVRSGKMSASCVVSGNPRMIAPDFHNRASRGGCPHTTGGIPPCSRTNGTARRPERVCGSERRRSGSAAPKDAALLPRTRPASRAGLYSMRSWVKATAWIISRQGCFPRRLEFATKEREANNDPL